MSIINCCSNLPARVSVLSIQVALATVLFAATTYAQTIPSGGSFTLLGTRSNSSNPSAWEPQQFNVTALIPGASSAILSFDLRNDVIGYSGVPNTSTASEIRFASELGNYYMQFAWVGGQSTSHIRNVTLLVDGVLYRDQYANFDDHSCIGTYGAWIGEVFGCAYDGSGTGQNVRSQSDVLARTFILSLPATVSSTSWIGATVLTCLLLLIPIRRMVR